MGAPLSFFDRKFLRCGGWFVIDDTVARGRQYDDYLIAQNFEPKLLHSERTCGGGYTKRTPTEADALASFPFVAEAALSMLRRHTS